MKSEGPKRWRGSIARNLGILEAHVTDSRREEDEEGEAFLPYAAHSSHPYWPLKRQYHEISHVWLFSIRQLLLGS